MWSIEVGTIINQGDWPSADSNIYDLCRIWLSQERQPQLFDEGADEQGQVRADVGILSEDDEVDAQTAANACPSGAIVIEY